MYIPSSYREEDWKEVEYLIKNYPLATVITHSEVGLVANHFPFYLVEREGKRFLHAHIAKSNPQIPDLTDNSEVLVIFKSEDNYITPNYYPGKQETHKYVPTWDFASAHIKGKSKLIDDFDFVRTQLNHITDQLEKDQPEPWKVSDAPENYLKIKQKAIIGLEIEIVVSECKYKFEQGMRKKDIDGVIEGLAKDNHQVLSDIAKNANVRADILNAKKKAEKSENAKIT